MTEVSKGEYINKLDEVFNKCSNLYCRTITIISADVKLGTFIEYGVEHNEKYPILKAGDCVRISKYKIFLQKVALQIGLIKYL